MNFLKMLVINLSLLLFSSCGRGLKVTKLTPGNSASPQVVASFITSWDTSKTGNVANNDDVTITLPLQSSCTYNFTVNWGDGSPLETITDWNDSKKTHTYSSRGIKTVEIQGTLGCLSFDADGDQVSDGDASKLVDVVQWGSNQWQTMEAMFFGADQLISFSATDIPDLSQVTNMSRTFKFSRLFNGDIHNWNTSQVVIMDEMFRGAVSFNQNIGDWNTSQVQVMRSMFQGALAFNQDIGGWDTSSVLLMESMFAHTANFNQDIRNWDTSHVTNMDHMFELALNFSEDLSGWNVNSVFGHNDFNLGNSLLTPPLF